VAYALADETVVTVTPENETFSNWWYVAFSLAIGATILVYWAKRRTTWHS